MNSSHISKMLSYLASDKSINNRISLLYDGIYQASNFSINEKEYSSRDTGGLIIDTIKQKIEWWAEDEHPHNGSSYNKATGEVPYLSIYNNLLELCKTKSRKEVAKQIEKEHITRADNILKSRADNTLKSILDDKTTSPDDGENFFF